MSSATNDDGITRSPSGDSDPDHTDIPQYEIRVKGHLGHRWAAWFDVLYLVTFVGSIPALPLYHNIHHNPTYLLGHASDTGVLWGAIGEIICALAGIGTAVALYPVAKRHSQTAALGFVAARTLEATMNFVGVLSVLVWR